MNRRRPGLNSVIGVAAVDLFASAMGVFIILSIIMVPFFLKKEDVLGMIQGLRRDADAANSAAAEATARAEELRGDLDRALGSLADRNAQVGTLRGQLDDVQSELAGAKPNVVIAIAWDANRDDDIDLHVKDPDGNHIFYKNRSFPNGSELTVDSQDAGAEVFGDPSPDDGEYVICYHSFAQGNAPTPVRAFLFFNDRVELPVITMQRWNQKIEVARLRVSGREGQVLTETSGQLCSFSSEIENAG